jgi:hypothetical protein
MGLGLELQAPSPGPSAGSTAPGFHMLSSDEAAGGGGGGGGAFDWAPVLSTLAPPAREVDLGALADDGSPASAILAEVRDLHDEPLRLIWVAAHQPEGPGSAALLFAWECSLLLLDGNGSGGGSESGEGRVPAAAAATAAAAGPQQQEEQQEQGQPPEREGQPQEQQQEQGGACPRAGGGHWPEMVAHLGGAAGAQAYRVSAPPLPHRPQLCVQGLTFEPGAAAPGDAPSAPPATAAAAADGWRTYALAVRGGFSLAGPHATTFPNAIADLSDGRVLHNARSLADVAAFTAVPVEAAIREHAANLARCALQRRGAVLPPEWCLSLLRARWGDGALRRFGVGLGTVLALGVRHA